MAARNVVPVSGARAPVLAALLVASLAACGEPRPTGRSLLLVTVDTVRRDALGFHGNAPSPSPAMDALAAQAVVFEDAYSVAPLTLPAHASLLTGLYPAAHGIRDNGAGKLPDDARTLAEHLGRAGYRARAAVAAFVLDPVFGLEQGFERYSAPPRSPSDVQLNVVQLRAGEMVDRALEDLTDLTAGEAPFFYWLHLYDPHAPFDPPGTGPGDRDAGPSRELYEAEIRYADRELGRVFDFLRARGLWDDLCVVLTSDHGEGLADGHEETHGFFVYDETMRIPLVVKHPELAPGRFPAQASLVDLMPTLLGLLGVPVRTDEVDGVDLGPALRGDASVPERVLLLESYQPYVAHGWAPFEGGVQGTWKYVRSKREELFERGADPRERTNLWADGHGDGSTLAKNVRARFRAVAGRLDAARVALDADGRDALAELGYVGAGGDADGGTARGGDELDFAALPDPHERYPLFARMMALSSTIHAGKIDEAIAELRALRAIDPKNPVVQEHLAEMLLAEDAGNAEEARALYEAVLAQRPARVESRLGIANATHFLAEAARERLVTEQAAGRLRAAAQARRAWQRLEQATVDGLRSVLEIEPGHPTALQNLALVLAARAEERTRAGDVDGAEVARAEAVERLERLLDGMGGKDPRRGELVRLRDGLARR